MALLLIEKAIVSYFASCFLSLFNPDFGTLDYVGELVFNMLVLVGAVKMADHVIREMMGL